MREAFQFRARLNPYFYTTGALASQTSISMLHPVYYDYPEFNESYDFKYQYLLGDDLLVAPVSSPMDANGVATKQFFVPPGQWVPWTGGAVLNGPISVSDNFTLSETPLFVKLGAVIPMKFVSIFSL